MSIAVPPIISSIANKAEQIVKEYFEQFNMEPQKGSIKIADYRYILMRGPSLSIEFFELIRNVFDSEKEADEFSYQLLYDLAYNMGRSDAKSFQSHMQIDETAEDYLVKIMTGPAHFNYTGWASVHLFKDSRPTQDENCLFLYEHPNSFESQAWITKNILAHQPICAMNAGYAAGWVSESSGVGLDVVELSCEAMGHEACRFIMAPPHKMHQRMEEYCKKYKPEANDLCIQICQKYFSKEKLVDDNLQSSPLQVNQMSCTRFFKSTAEQQLLKHARQLENTQELLENNVKELSKEIQKHRQTQNALKESQVSLKESEKQFRSIFNTVPHGIILYKRNQSGELIIKDFNPSATKILGTHLEDLRFKNIFEVFPNVDHEVIKALHNGFDHQTSWSSEDLHYEDDQISGAYEVSIFPSSSDTVACMFQDITERKKYQIKIEELNENLEQRVKDRTEQIEKMQHEITQQAHQSGMAQIATNVLHNVGNLLNGVGFAIHDINEICDKSIINKFYNANAMLEKQLDNIEQYITENPKGKQLLQYYLALQPEIENEHQRLKQFGSQLMQHLNAINDIIIAQMHVASGPSFSEELNLTKLIPDIITMIKPSLIKHKIHLNTDLNPVESIQGQRSKMIHIFTNLIKNAKESILDSDNQQKEIGILLYQNNGHLTIEIKDSGNGIEEKDFARIFNHGFTTKTQGHGFGLHSCANYIAEMEGHIKVTSSGKGKGATFILQFPKKRTGVKHEQ